MENGEQKIEYEVPEFISDKTENVGDKEEDFEVLQVIGAGAFSEVLKVRSKINFGFYAMKKIDINKADDLVGLENEGKFLQKLNHPNIVKIYKVFKDKSERYLYFIMELLDNGDLLQFKDALISSEKHAPEPLLWKIFYSCLLGLGYIHNEEIIHRDIKPNNLFIDENLNIKIGDFNISVCNSIEAAKKFSGSNDKEKYSLMENQYEKAGTEEYSAPEVTYNEQGYDSKIDVYSMGTTFFEICYFKNHRFVERKYEDYLDTDLYSRELNELIEKMIEEEPDNRISSTEAKKIAKKNYILKYVKNSSTGAVFRCFYSYKNFKYYFTEIINKNNDSVFNLPGKEVGKKVYQLFGALKENNIDNINDILYELRLELVKIGLKEQREDVEIDPGNLIFYILSRLNSELNELPSDKPIQRTNIEYKKMSRNYKIQSGKEEEFFKERLGLYNKRELSIISRNFYHFIITDIICEKCKDSGRYFSQTYFIPFNVEILSKKVGNDNLDIKKAFDCLLNDKIQINPRKAKSCANCGEKKEIFIKKRFFHTSKNLIIILDRGINGKNETFVEFDETLELTKNEVERFNGIKYELVGMVEKLKDDSYISFTKENDSWSSSNGLSKSFDEAKKFGTVFALFYYCDDNKLVLESIQSALSNPVSSNNDNDNDNNTITKTKTIQPTKSNMGINNSNNVNNMKYNQNLINSAINAGTTNINNYNINFNGNNNTNIMTGMNIYNNNNTNQNSQMIFNNNLVNSHMNFTTNLNPNYQVNNNQYQRNNGFIGPNFTINPMPINMNMNMGMVNMGANIVNQMRLSNGLNNMNIMNNNINNMNNMNNNMNNMNNFGMNNMNNNFMNNQNMYQGNTQFNNMFGYK